MVPVDVADLTPEWFGAALGAAVTGAEVVDASSGTTGRARVRLTGGADVPETVFVKLAPFVEAQRAFIRRAGIGLNEARFYGGLAGEVPVRVPRPLHAATDDDGNYVMVLEDLLVAGCTFPRPSDADIADRAVSTVEELARLHAAFWESPRFEGDLAWVPERAGFGSAGRTAAPNGSSFVGRALELFGADMPAAFAHVGSLYVERTADVLDLWDEGERTLIHGDPHMGNLFVDAGRTGFLDWAMFSRSPGIRDVAYFCCNSIPPEVRREVEHDLLRRYCEVLAEDGVGLDPALAWEQYRLFAVYSWVSATATASMGGRWQPEKIGRGGMGRATAAITDLDSAGLLEERLRERAPR